MAVAVGAESETCWLAENVRTSAVYGNSSKLRRLSSPGFPAALPFKDARCGNRADAHAIADEQDHIARVRRGARRFATALLHPLRGPVVVGKFRALDQAPCGKQHDHNQVSGYSHQCFSFRASCPIRGMLAAHEASTTLRSTRSVALALLPALALAHGVSSRDALFVAGVKGVNFGPFMYLGAKHMVTGYDHLLFLAGVIFFLYRLKDVALYVTLFAVGHSTTLLGAVLGASTPMPTSSMPSSACRWSTRRSRTWAASRSWAGSWIRARAVLAFGLAMASASPPSCRNCRCRARAWPPTWWLQRGRGSGPAGRADHHGAVVCVVAQVTGSFRAAIYPANVLLMAAGFVFVGYQMAGYVVHR